jgi:hypothetical protein
VPLHRSILGPRIREAERMKSVPQIVQRSACPMFDDRARGTEQACD